MKTTPLQIQEQAYTVIMPFDEFAINGSTGELYLKTGTVLDYESVLNITFLVQARDFGEPTPLFSTALVFVSIDRLCHWLSRNIWCCCHHLLTIKYHPTLAWTRSPFGIMREVTTITITNPDPSSPITATLDWLRGEVGNLESCFGPGEGGNLRK